MEKEQNSDPEKELAETHAESRVGENSRQEHEIQSGSITISEGIKEEGEEEVHVIYLNVPETDEPQVLDLSSLLVQEGIQIVEPSKTTDQISSIQGINGTQDIVIENNSGTEITMVASQSEAQSAHALLHLAKSQGEVQEVQMSEILAAQRQSDHIIEDEQNATSAEALLQLSSDANGGTYIVDENGSMIPLNQVRSTTLLEVDDTATAVTTVAICHCWCGREFISQEDLDRHVLAHKYQSQPSSTSSQGEQKCVLCDLKFATTKELKEHHTEMHPGGVPWECSVCCRRFSKKIALKAHMRVHNTVTRYQCSACKKMFFYKTALTRHLKMHTCDKPFKCTICGDLFHTLWDLRKHRMNHQTPKLFPCDICTKVFRQKQTLFVHSRIHTGQRPYSCDICSRSFSLKSTLVQHRRIHTGEKPNICPVCHRGFRQNSTLKSHLKIHTNLKPYMCRYCKMRFAYSDEVAEHEHIHIYNKNWQCDDCGMRFKNQSLLQRHTRVHTNERPFQCNICLKTFVQSGSLQAHIRSHTKERPYQCRMCSKAYSTSGTLLIHIRRAHNVDAKSVKEIFPVFNYIEDQKVFTIRNKPLVNTEPFMDVEKEKESQASEADIGNPLSKANTVVQGLTETSGEIIGEDNKVLMENGNSVADAAVTETKEEVDHNVNYLEDGKAGLQSSDTEMAKDTRKVKEEDVKTSETTEKSSDENKEDSHNSHAAHDRQEAALGLAELALIGGEGMQIEKNQPQKLRTFFKEEEEDENDPNVTKIILSKEGGIMNSQDPHQCPVCGRIFGRKSIMVEHLRIHTDEKPYECDFCQAAFRQNAQLRSHIRNKHTQIERYQCSFCHKRFLSRNITVKHIYFHHKLKLKFCESVDPAWTIDSAVWCDANFELNVKNPQFLNNTNKKVKKNANTIKNDKAPCPGNPEVGVQIQTIQGHPNEEKSIAGPVSLTMSDSRNISIKTTETSTNVSQENVEATSIKSDVNEKDTVIGSSLKEKKGMTSLGHQVALSREDVEQESSLEVKESPSSSGIKSISDNHFGSSRLLCETCSMQFRGISSLRYHLRKVHNTTLDQSDVSYIYEDEKGYAQQTTVTLEVDATSNQDTQILDTVNIETAGDTAENIPLKIIVYDDTSKCVDDPKFMPHKCLMCSMRCTDKTELEEHMKYHTEEEVEKVGMHQCDLCSSVLKNTQQITKHILKFHGVQKIYICSICHREFYQQSSVQRHMKFFHKWEMKIRGESSIPILTKPAPTSLQHPGGGPKYRKDSVAGHNSQVTSIKSAMKSKKSEGENKMTYISLNVGDMDNLQIYRPDGKEVNFEVVSSRENVKTLKITEEELNRALTESAKSGNEESSNVFLLSSSQIEPSVSKGLKAPHSVGDDATSEQVINSSSVIDNLPTSDQNIESPYHSSLTIVGDDRSASISVRKEIVDQLLKQVTPSNSGYLQLAKETKLSEVTKHTNNENDEDNVEIDSERSKKVVTLFGNDKSSSESTGNFRQGMSRIKVSRPNISNEKTNIPGSQNLKKICSPSSKREKNVIPAFERDTNISHQNHGHEKDVEETENKCHDIVQIDANVVSRVTQQNNEKSEREIGSSKKLGANIEKSPLVLVQEEESHSPIVMSVKDIGRCLSQVQTSPSQCSLNKTATFIIDGLDYYVCSSENKYEENKRGVIEVEVNEEVEEVTSCSHDTSTKEMEKNKSEAMSLSNIGHVDHEEIETSITENDQDVSHKSGIDQTILQNCSTENTDILKREKNVAKIPIGGQHLLLEETKPKLVEKKSCHTKQEVKIKICNTSQEMIITSGDKTTQFSNRNIPSGQAKIKLSEGKSKRPSTSEAKLIRQQLLSDIASGSKSRSKSQQNKPQISEEKSCKLQSKESLAVSEKALIRKTVSPKDSNPKLKTGNKKIVKTNIGKKVASPDKEIFTTERRSSSGRLIKKKKFDDEIQPLASPKRTKKDYNLMN